MAGDEPFAEAIHALLKEFGWTHGEITPSLVLQALAQVRHLKKMADALDQARKDLAAELVRSAAERESMLVEIQVLQRRRPDVEIARLDGEVTRLRAALDRVKSARNQACEMLLHADLTVTQYEIARQLLEVG